MILNPKKYVFGVSSEKLFDYMVSSRGIDANSKKVEVKVHIGPHVGFGGLMTNN
jgi:hypothetical protein